MKIQKKKIGGVGGGVGGGSGGGVRVDVNEELKFWGKLKKNNIFFFFWGGGGSGGGAVGLGGQVRCERSIEVFGKIQKKNLGGGSGGGVGLGGVRVDVNKELKFL